MNRASPDFRGRVSFLPEKKSPVFQGYRADLAYKKEVEGLFMIWPRFLDSTLQEKEEKSEIQNPCLANFWIVNPELRNEVHRQNIKIGTEFWVCEGTSKVGEVVVTEILESLK